MGSSASVTPEQEKTGEALKKLLAETYILYLKTHGYHWNVEGPRFPQLHAMFETQYNELWIALDEIAERLRAINVYAPASYQVFSELSQIKDDVGTPPPAEKMLLALAEGHEIASKTSHELLRIAEEAGDDGTADLATGRLRVHDKTAWMLRSSL